MKGAIWNKNVTFLSNLMIIGWAYRVIGDNNI